MKLLKHPHWRSSVAMQLRARELRRAMTPAEKTRSVWYHIRDNQLGAQFRRQHAVGSYIVDFFCAKAKLVIEVDGDSHADPKQAEYDAERTQWLNEQRNFQMIRFWNNDILGDVESVVTNLSQILDQSASVQTPITSRVGSEG